MPARGDSPGAGTPPGQSRAPAVGVEAAPLLRRGPPWVEAAPEQRDSSEGTAPQLETASPHEDTSLRKAGPATSTNRAYPAAFDFAEFGGGLCPILG